MKKHKYESEDYPGHVVVERFELVGGPTINNLLNTVHTMLCYIYIYIYNTETARENERIERRSEILIRILVVIVISMCTQSDRMISLMI